MLWQNANANLPGCHAYRKGENDRSLIRSDNKTDRSTRHQLSDRVASLNRLQSRVTIPMKLNDVLFALGADKNGVGMGGPGS